MEEVWKDIPHYEGLYQVSNLGRVWSVRSQKCLKFISKGNGYYKVNLYSKNGRMKNESVHRLVAMAFIPNPNNLPQVNHIDEDKSNNRADNLEWCTIKYNNTYGTRVKRAAKSNCKPINQYDLKGNFIKRYGSIKEAKEIFGNSIYHNLNGNTRTAYGYIWKYAEEVSANEG